MAFHFSPATSLLAIYFLKCETDPEHKSFSMRFYQQEFPIPRAPSIKSLNHFLPLMHTNPQSSDTLPQAMEATI